MVKGRNRKEKRRGERERAQVNLKKKLPLCIPTTLSLEEPGCALFQPENQPVTDLAPYYKINLCYKKSISGGCLVEQLGVRVEEKMGGKRGQTKYTSPADVWPPIFSRNLRPVANAQQLLPAYTSEPFDLQFTSLE